MKTEDLVGMLARGAGAVDPAASTRRFAFTTGGGAIVALALVAVLLGPRHDLAQVILLPMFWAKFAYVAALAMTGVLCAYRLGHPGMRSGHTAIAAALIIAAMAGTGAIAYASADAPGRHSLFFGQTWRSCPWLIAAFSMPVLAATAWAMRGLAPTNLRVAGAAAGFAAGTVAALVYSFHCPELGAPFLATWYVLGILIPTAVGGLLGERLLRWQ